MLVAAIVAYMLDVIFCSYSSPDTAADHNRPIVRQPTPPQEHRASSPSSWPHSFVVKLKDGLLERVKDTDENREGDTP
jgi:hypothetical protein